VITKVIDTIRSCRTEEQLECAAQWALGVGGEHNRELVEHELAAKAAELQAEMDEHDRIQKEIKEIPW